MKNGELITLGLVRTFEMRLCYSL